MSSRRRVSPGAPADDGVGSGCGVARGVQVALSFQVNIRHNVDAASDEFGGGTVRFLEGRRARIGGAPDCECPISDPELPGLVCTILAEAGCYRVVFADETTSLPTFLNDSAVSGEAGLVSGDEIRIGHWTLRFQKVYDPVAHARDGGLLAAVTRVCVSLIFVGEIGVVAWLQLYMRRAALSGEDVSRHWAVIMVDSLRSANTVAEPADELERAARETLGRHLDRMARYIRTHEDNLSRRQWKALSEQIRKYVWVNVCLTNHTAFSPIPPLATDAGVRAALGMPIEDEPANGK